MLKDRDDRAKQASNNRLRAIDQSERSEEELRKAEQQEVETLMETNQGNEGSNHSAMYELCGGSSLITMTKRQRWSRIRALQQTLATISAGLARKVVMSLRVTRNGTSSTVGGHAVSDLIDR